MPDGSALAAVSPRCINGARAIGVTAVANLGAFGLRDVTRLAVSPKGDRTLLSPRRSDTIERIRLRSHHGSRQISRSLGAIQTNPKLSHSVRKAR
jgi:hypothetical protein